MYLCAFTLRASFIWGWKCAELHCITCLKLRLAVASWSFFLSFFLSFLFVGQRDSWSLIMHVWFLISCFDLLHVRFFSERIVQCITLCSYIFSQFLYCMQTSSFFLHIFKVQFVEKRIQIGGKHPSGLFLANISLLLSEQVPFAEKNLTV